MSSTGKTPPFEQWLTTVSPTWIWDWPYQRYIQGKLEAVTRGDLKKLMIFMPPRHGKSRKVTVRYSAWRLERDPATRVAVGCYGQSLADKFSREIRGIVRPRIGLSEERTAAVEWETTSGGGVKAVGVGAGITGHGFDLLVIDDPIKSREEANSEAYRERVWNWYTDDLYTRQEPGAAIILIMTRWHEDDLAGRILESEEADSWEVINLPAEAEENDPLGRKVGEALCPARYDEAALADLRATLGRSYYALFQQRPLPAEGGLLKPEWFEIVDASPALCRRVRYWDNGGGGEGSDPTSGCKIGEYKGIYYIEDVRRGTWGAMEREQVKRQAAIMDGTDCRIWNEQEPGSSGKESAQATVRNLAGFSVHIDRVTGDKASRAEPLAAQAQAGNVKLVKGAWNAAFLTECASFPDGKNDDQVDSASGAFNKLALGGQAKTASTGKVY